MEIYNGTGVLKTNDLKVTKSIGALLLKSDQPFSALTNEKISMYVERTNSDNEQIAVNVPLNAFIATNVFGEGKLLDDGSSYSVLCELTDYGSIDLAEDETLVLKLDGLKSARTYEVHGIEMPVRSNKLITYAEKVLLAGQKRREYEVYNFDEAFVTGDFDTIKLTYMTSEGNKTVEYTQEEARAISADIGLIIEGANTQITQTLVSLVNVSSIEVFSDTALNIILRDVPN